MDCSVGTSLRIGGWRIDPRLNEMSCDGRTVRLEARAMRLLLRLAARPGEVVSVDDLLNDVWAGVVVTSDSVYQAIASLRRELGDDARQPTYIATVPRLGYRMVATVCPWTDEELPAERPSTISTDEQTTLIATASNRRWIPFTAAAFLTMVIVLSVFLKRQEVAGNVSMSDSRSVVVIPFLDLTTQAMEQEYFADGLTEEVINRLSKLPDVQVAPPTTSFALKDKELTASEAGRSLQAAYVVDGSIRQSDTLMRIAVRLVRTSDGYVVWAESYDKPLADKLRTQDEVAQKVIEAIKLAVVPPD